MNVRRLANTRKAISPVLATVILIAITLIAAIAIGGFVFGLFGSYTSTAQVTVTQTSLDSNTWTTGTADSSLVASNTGSSNTVVTSISLTYGGQTCSPQNAGLGTVTAGSSLTIDLSTQTAGGCTTQPSSGQQFTGSLSLSNGGTVEFAGTFQ
jgi:archaeal type IV pilus assembly protein PilA